MVESRRAKRESTQTGEVHLTQPKRGVKSYLLVALVALLVGAVCGWALVTVLRPADAPLDVTRTTYVAAQEGSVGDEMSVSVFMNWSTEAQAVNRAVGTITGIEVAADKETAAGDRLYTVDLRPVVVAKGSVPMFREISRGTAGADVAQLQELLKTLGLFEGEADGTAGAGTENAIFAWQERLGVAKTGVVSVGDVVFVADLPARIRLNSEVMRVGAQLNGGENAFAVMPKVPEFEVFTTKQQAQKISAGLPVQVTSPGGETWQATVGEQRVDAETGEVIVALGTADGGPLCGSECGELNPESVAPLPARIVLSETVTGVTVPSAALISAADGSLYVLDETGSEHPVTVKVSAQGMSVVEGLAAGTRVRVPGMVREQR